MQQDPIKLRVIQIADNARKAGVEMYPMLYCMVATAANDRVTLYNEIHYTKEEAVAAFEASIEKVTGMPPSAWRIKMVACISAEILESKFKEYAEKIEAEKKKEKNALMAEIIASKDVNLLHRHYSRFTNEEVLYMHEKIV